MECDVSWSVSVNNRSKVKSKTCEKQTGAAKYRLIMDKILLIRELYLAEDAIHGCYPYRPLVMFVIFFLTILSLVSFLIAVNSLSRACVSLIQ